MKNKDYGLLYDMWWKALRGVTEFNKWERDLSVKISVGKILLSTLNLYGKRTNLQNFTINFYIGYLSLKKELYLYGTSESFHCTFRFDKSLFHSKQFVNGVLQQFDEENVTSSSQSDEEPPFGFDKT